MARIPRPDKWVNKQIRNQVQQVISKVNYPTVGYGKTSPRNQDPAPPYERQVNPRWIYNLRQNSTLVNNSIEEKVSQTFRRGFTEWEKEYQAKCTQCKEEFESLEPFKDELGQFGQQLEDEEVDLDSPRVCPECGELSEIEYPSEEDKEEGQDFFRQCNEKTDVQTHLEPTDQNSVGQSFAELCKELAWDIQSFDDAWMLFEREYITDPDSGVILDYELKECHRAPPELMRYSVREDGEFGGQYWVCVECRAKHDNYSPETEPRECSECGGYTYEVYAMSLEEPGGDPTNFYMRGEFVHASEYEPSKYYGYSPILTLWEESRTIENMDEWYKSAYKERRAPRGAMLIRSSNAESVRSFNKGQMEKLRSDKHYIPTFIDDTDNSGKALEWVNLLEDPAEMQHMEMREWFLERISAKYGVTSAFQKGSPNNSGLSQSLEIVVSNRSADRLRRIFNTTFVPAVLGQLDLDGWERELRPVEEEEEDAKAEVQSKYLQNATRAEEAGFEYEWTEEDRLKIYPGKPGGSEEGGEEGQMPPDPTAEAGEGSPDMQGGAPGAPAHQDPRLEQSEDSKGPVTTDSSGYGNVRFGGGGEEIDVLGNLRELFDEEEIDVSKGAVSWDEIDISSTIKIWIEDPEDAPINVDVKYDEVNSPEDTNANFYYTDTIATTNLGKMERINKRAEAIDFLWRPSPKGLVKQSEGTGEYSPYEPPESCSRQYIESMQGDPPDEAQIFEGPNGKKFYCQNYDSTGTWAEGEEPFSEDKPIKSSEEVNDELGEDVLYPYENLYEFDSWGDVSQGQKMIVEADGETKALQYEQSLFGGTRRFKDIENDSKVMLSNSEIDVQGVIGENLTEKYEGRYDTYEPPRDIYSPDNVESKEQLENGGGVNSEYTREVEFDNGQNAIYKNFPGLSHDYTLDGEVAAYETFDLLFDDDTFPETARADLKNGFGSAQMWVEDSENMKGELYNQDVDTKEVMDNNKERIAQMTLIDVLTGNTDRHANNIRLNDDGKLFAIDNGGHGTPKEELESAHMNTLSNFKQHLEFDSNLGGDAGNDMSDDEIEEYLEEYAEEVAVMMEHMLDAVEENKDEIYTKYEEFYGPHSSNIPRIRNLLEETDDEEIKLREMIGGIQQEMVLAATGGMSATFGSGGPDSSVDIDMTSVDWDSFDEVMDDIMGDIDI